MSLRAGQKLSHYRIDEKIGEGGMGEVYRATDMTLDRPVAIKVLPESLADDPDRLQRFQREARAVAGLNHPHIVTIYAVEEVDGIRLLVMELVDGERLDSALPAGQAPLDRIFDLGISLADALSAAHKRGVVHRDLKPANVMLTTDGRAKILDFGLAKQAATARSTGGPDDVATQAETEALTEAGVVMGTVPYMSPEQVQGRPVDHRSDLFSLGVMLYELATGRRPFGGDSTAETISSILRDEPTPVDEARGEAPRHLGRIVAHCLEKDPCRRFQTAIDLRNELEALRTEIAQERLRGGRSGEAAGAKGSGAAEAVRPCSIAILPFTDMSPGKDQEYLCDGLAEDIINSMTRVGGCSVAARTSAFSFKGKKIDIREIGTTLRVDSVLEGSIQKAGDRLRISAQLINVADGYHLWSERYDRQMDDVFAIQDEISAAIVEKLRGEAIPSGEQTIARRRPDDVEAYRLYLKGRHHWNRRTETGLLRGVEYFQQAVEKAPDYVLAYVGLADSYDILGFYSYLRPEEAFPRAKEAAQKALAMDESLAEAHVSLGYVHLYYDWDWQAAEREFRRAIELNPDYAVAHQWYGNLLAPIGRLDEALAEGHRALELDPLSLIINSFVGWAHYMRRNYDQAITDLRKAQELDRTFVMARMWCGWAYQQKGMHPEALAELEAAAKHSDHGPFAEANLAHGAAVSGDAERARRILADLTKQSADRYVPAYFLALVWLGLGDHDRTFECLERAVEERSHWLVFLNIDSRHDPIRTDPRFADLVRRIGLPSAASNS